MRRQKWMRAALPDQPTQQAWESIRAEALHEQQEGGEVQDAQLDAIGDMLAKFPYKIIVRKHPSSRPIAA